MIETQLVFRNEYRLDLKKFDSVIIPYLFNNSDTNLIISVEAETYRKYRSVGRVEQLVFRYPRNLIVSSQILRFGDQEFEFLQRGDFRLQFIPNYYLGRVNLEIKRMFFGDNLTAHQQPTYAKPSKNISVGNSKKEIVPEVADGTRQSYLLQNTGSATAYFKYVAMGSTVADTTISATDCDFSLTVGEKFLDSLATKNGLIAINSGLSLATNIRVIEYFFS